MSDLDLTLSEARYITARTGNNSFEVTGGGGLRILTKVDGDTAVYEVLNVACPAGKTWKVQLVVNITERNGEF